MSSSLVNPLTFLGTIRHTVAYLTVTFDPKDSCVREVLPPERIRSPSCNIVAEVVCPPELPPVVDVHLLESHGVLHEELGELDRETVDLIGLKSQRHLAQTTEGAAAQGVEL